MAKLTEKQLFGTCLDIYYADKLNDDFVSDLSDQLKDARAAKRKSARLPKKANEHYFSVIGKNPIYNK